MPIGYIHHQQLGGTMRGLIFSIALLASTSALAESWVSTNRGGGEITLTDRVCRFKGKEYPKLREAYSWTNSIVVEGCWSLLDDMVHVIWFEPDGGHDKRVYPPQGFVKKSN